MREHLCHVREQLRPDYMVGLEQLRHRGSMMKVVSDPNRLEYDDDAASALIDRAKLDSNVAASLRGIACEFIERGEALPPNMRTYVVSVLAEPESVPKRPQGRRRNQPRDVQIATAVYLACQHGLKATRGDQPSADSAECGCSIVASVLADMGIGIAEKRVRQIWDAHAHMRS